MRSREIDIRRRLAQSKNKRGVLHKHMPHKVMKRFLKLCNFGKICSGRDRGTCLNERTQSENEMPVWTQRLADRTNGEFL